ncbi:MAG: hypothetical protein ACRD18_09105 [Terriglobia bacterium]
MVRRNGGSVRGNDFIERLQVRASNGQTPGRGAPPAKPGTYLKSLHEAMMKQAFSRVADTSVFVYA